MLLLGVGGVLGGAAFSVVFSWALLPGLLLWVLLRFFLFFSVVLPSFPAFGLGFPFSSVGWCCLASSFFGSWCFATSHDGLGVGVLGSWVVRCCVLGRVLGGLVGRWRLVVECRVGCWVAKRMGGRVGGGGGEGGGWGECSVSGLVLRCS